MHFVLLQPLDQCGIQNADTLAFAAGQADVNGASATAERHGIGAIDPTSSPADRGNTEGLNPLRVTIFLDGLGMPGRR